jgi:protoporphyrinogen oxidase
MLMVCLSLTENVLRQKEESGWGPNAVFRFPQEGGTGAIWKKVAALLPAKQQRYNSTITTIDAEAKVVVLADGNKIKYQRLLTTIPLDITLTWLGRQDLAKRLTYSSSHIIGLGIRGDNPHDHKCWMYYPVRTARLCTACHALLCAANRNFLSRTAVYR